MKRFLAIVAAMVLLLSGCTPVENELFHKLGEIQEITVYAPIKGTDNRGVGMNKEGRIVSLSNFEAVHQIRDSEEVQKIIDMFKGWNKKDNWVHPDNDTIPQYDLLYVRFDEKLTLSYTPETGGKKYIGKVETESYYLPTDFCEYLSTILLN